MFFVLRSAPTLLFVMIVAGLTVTNAQTIKAQSDQVISGAPSVIAGDLLEVGGTRVRLYAIDAPEVDQMCERKGKQYPCGTVSIAALKDLTAGLTRVTCFPTGKTADGTLIARCQDPQKFDLSQQMVYTGWALALPDAATLFHDLQQKSQTAKRGLWKGQVTPPWRWQGNSSDATK